jgi:hypothetical protein
MPSPWWTCCLQILHLALPLAGAAWGGGAVAIWGPARCAPPRPPSPPPGQRGCPQAEALRPGSPVRREALVFVEELVLVDLAGWGGAGWRGRRGGVSAAGRATAHAPALGTRPAFLPRLPPCPAQSPLPSPIPPPPGPSPPFSLSPAPANPCPCPRPPPHLARVLAVLPLLRRRHLGQLLLTLLAHLAGARRRGGGGVACRQCGSAGRGAGGAPRGAARAPLAPRRARARAGARACRGRPAHPPPTPRATHHGCCACAPSAAAGRSRAGGARRGRAAAAAARAGTGGALRCCAGPGAACPPGPRAAARLAGGFARLPLAARAPRGLGPARGCTVSRVRAARGAFGVPGAPYVGDEQKQIDTAGRARHSKATRPDRRPPRPYQPPPAAPAGPSDRSQSHGCPAFAPTWRGA